MTADNPERYDKILARLDTVHEDLTRIQPNKDLNIITKPLPANGAVLLGFPGSGLVGTIALQYMVDQLGFELVGSMTSRYFPPLAMMSKGLINDPVRVYAKDIGGMNITAIVADTPSPPRSATRLQMPLSAGSNRLSQRRS